MTSSWFPLLQAFRMNRIGQLPSRITGDKQTVESGRQPVGFFVIWCFVSYVAPAVLYLIWSWGVFLNYALGYLIATFLSRESCMDSEFFICCCF